jgi:FkbM family methyltransferase
MTPTLNIRSFTNDQYILDKVFYSNCYRIRGFEPNEKKPVVVDIGAHCGFFTFAAMSLGAKKVFCFEPFTPNYIQLIKNVGDTPFGTSVKVIPYQLGVYVAPVALTFGWPELINKSYFNYSEIGMDHNPTSVEFSKCPMVTLDTILEHYVGENVDILKLSIGYAEMAILDSSSRLATSVSNICGEIGVDADGQNKLRGILAKQGFNDIEFLPVEGETGRVIFQASKGSRKDVFI